MYQGKFNRQTDTDIYTLLRQRQEQNQRRRGGKPGPRQAPAAPRQGTAARPLAAERPGRGKGNLIFATVLMGFVFVFYLATFLGLKWIQGWLVDFEAAQPTTKSREVFAELFQDPDWDRLYDLSAPSVDRESFVAYMEDRVGSRELGFLETSSGLAQDVKTYILRLEGQKIGTFTLRDHNRQESGQPQWELESVTFLIQGGQSYRLQVPKGAQVYLGDALLGEEAVTAVSASPAGQYLPTFAQAPSTLTYTTQALLAEPAFRVLDAAGQELTVTYDEESQCYTAGLAPEEIPQDRQELALNAVTAYARFMANEGDISAVNKYFSRDTDTYRSIAGTERHWIQTGSSYSLTEQQVFGYRTYGESVFSVRVSMDLNVTRTEDGSVKTTHIAQSLFFTPNDAGKWMCFAMTGEDMERWTTQVRLTFLEGDQVLSSEFVDQGTSRLQCPAVTAPAGKTFAGWAIRETDEKGAEVMLILFTPDETGAVSLPAGTMLESMTLYPVYE